MIDTTTTSALREEVNSVPYWRHSIDLGGGVVTPGDLSLETLDAVYRSMRLPDLRGKSVLDICAWDGYHSFRAEREGAARVVAMDYYKWKTLPDPQGDPDFPGKRPFDIARRALDSRVESVAADYLDYDFAGSGLRADIVLYIGVLYHMTDLLGSIAKVSEATKELAVIETEAVVLPGYEGRNLCEYYARGKYTESDFWRPTLTATVAMCRDAGFRRVDVIEGEPAHAPAPRPFTNKVRRAGGAALRELGLKAPLKEQPRTPLYRAMLHAWK